MGRKTDCTKIITIDIECTAWDSKDTKFIQLNEELIEFGYALIDGTSFDIIENESYLVKPQLSKINEFCTNLTTIKQEDVDKEGTSFSAICNLIYTKWSNIAFASWGDFDRLHFQRQCEREKIKYPFNRTHYNIKNLYAFQNGLTNEVGLDTAFKNEGIPMKGRHHSAKDDAYNAAVMLCYLLNGDYEYE